MTPAEREKLIADLFHKAVDSAPADRKTYLDEVCRSLPDDIRAEVLFELLRPYQQACDSLAQRFGGHRAPYHGNGRRPRRPRRKQQ